MVTKSSIPLTFEKWYDSFQTSRNGRNALEKLKTLERLHPNIPSLPKHHPAANSFAILQSMVIGACYQAYTYNEENDPLTIERNESTAFLHEVDGHKQELKKVKAFIKQYKDKCDWALWYGHHDNREKNPNHFLILNKNDIEKQPIDWFLEILNAYETGLSQPIMGVKTGSCAHRFNIMNLMYLNVKDGKNDNNKPTKETALAFELALRFRKWTSPKFLPHDPGNIGYYRLMAGEEMPKDGKPHFDIVHAFIKATFNNFDISQRKIMDNVRKLTKQEVRLNSWPEMVENRS